MNRPLTSTLVVNQRVACRHAGPYRWGVGDWVDAGLLNDGGADPGGLGATVDAELVTGGGGHCGHPRPSYTAVQHSASHR